jgi:ABC-type transport system substrate-binding protein
VAPPGGWGYDPSYKGRTYNPEKARQLLAETGYPKGNKIELTAFAVGTWPVEAEAIAAHLRDIGIEVKVDHSVLDYFLNLKSQRASPCAMVFVLINS